MTYNVRTAHGTVHQMTAGRTFTMRGSARVNKPEVVNGKADCGALTSSAASHTTEAVNCKSCLNH